MIMDMIKKFFTKEDKVTVIITFTKAGKGYMMHIDSSVTGEVTTFPVKDLVAEEAAFGYTV